MNKLERVRAALTGDEVDRPPFSFWYHFGLQHLPGRRHAEAEIDFFRAYDLDFLKVMSDYPYPVPPGLEVIETDDDWKRVEPRDGRDSCWSEQLAALSIINDEIGGEAMFIETIFSPWTVARKMSRSGGLDQAVKKYPEVLLGAMAAISESLAAYANEAISRGASGIFFSAGAASADVMSVEEYRIWGAPFDFKVLEAVRDAPFNVLHVHGKCIHFDEVINHPAQAVNWSHFLTPPSLSDGKSRWGKTVLGGINEATASHVSPPEIAAQVENAITEAGERGLIITPGCSIPTDTSVRNMSAVKAALDRRRR